jgi:hypothetical protein
VAALLLAFGATAAQAATTLQNAGLEADANGDSMPDCWQQSGSGTNTRQFSRTTDAHAGGWAERLQISSLTSGDRALLSALDAGACAPAVAAGDSYRLSTWYKADAGARIVAYLRSSKGTWSAWKTGPLLSASAAWRQATWTTPSVPGNRTAIAFGMSMGSVGTLTVDDFTLSDAATPEPAPSPSPTPTPTPTPPPPPPPPPETTITVHPADPTTATDASFAFTSSASGSTFTCTLDGAAGPCTSPKAYASLATGSHTFTVAAKDSAGTADASPASFSWTVQVPAPPPGGCGKQTGWTAPQVQQAADRYLYAPLSDAAAAACVTAAPETVAANAQANAYVPSDAELAAFRAALSGNGKTGEQEEWYPGYVTGRPGLAAPTTDALIQWAAHKWGIPEDWMRAQYTQESDWRQGVMGDLRTESASWYPLFPAFSCPTSTQCYESLGITQVKWHPDGSEGAGTEPLRWKSTAFNIDYQASIIRFEYDNPYGKRASWGDASYHPLDQWLALSSWFSPYPYGNSSQLSYKNLVQQHLAARDWPQ